MKYYLSSLGSLASTLDDIEKMRVKKLTLEFLNQHNYFSQIWSLLDFNQIRKVLDIIASRKGVIPYEKIVLIDSLNSKPENGIFFTKDEFYSTLKGKAAGEEEYDNSNCFILF